MSNPHSRSQLTHPTTHPEAQRLLRAQTSRLPPRLAFEQTILSCQPDLRAFALRLTRSQAVAEDLVQDTLAKAWFHWDRFELGSNARAWTRRILFNVFVNHYRRGRRERRLLESYGQHRAVEQGECTWSGAERTDPEHEVGDEVREALDRLPNPFREVIVAVDLGGLSYEEAAQRLGCPPGTIMSRLHRARTALRSDLRAYAAAFGVAPSSAPADRAAAA